MTHLHDRTAVVGLARKVAADVDHYFSLGCCSGGVGRVRLRVPLQGAPYGVSLDREVRVEAWRARDDRNLNDVIRISWASEGGVVFPTFSGTLVVRGEADPTRSSIELDGHYQPPLGAAGELFDEAIGHRMAQSTVRELLEDIKRSMSSDVN
ncbi:MAG: hypothetical protein ABI431_08560 [Candidatus Tumulicola sp.]